MRPVQAAVLAIFTRELAAEIHGRIREHGRELTFDEMDRLLADCSRTMTPTVRDMPAHVIREIEPTFKRAGFELFTIEMWRALIAPGLGSLLIDALRQWVPLS